MLATEHSTSFPAPPDLDAEPWPVWLAAVLPTYCTARFARHHADLWEWVWAIDQGTRPEAFVGIWPRGGAKSTSAEAACVVLGAKRTRRYGLYVCDTQDRADDHVGNIGAMLESERVALWYPLLSERRVGKHGNSRGWRRNRLWTASGFVVDAIGLDTAARGVKLEDQRPDFIVIDDIDAQHDSAKITDRKASTLTKAILPAGSDDLAVLAIQNLIHRDGVFAQLADGRADFLQRRKVSGPVLALEQFALADDGTITGLPTWEGMDLERCRANAADWGLRSFLAECQHDVAAVEGAMWEQDLIDRTRWRDDVPDLGRVVVGVDPPGGATECGIVVAGVAYGPCACGAGSNHGFVVGDYSMSGPPDAWGSRAVGAYREHRADRLVAERNFGADMVHHVIDTVDPAVSFREAHASRGKQQRAEPVVALYEQGKVHHVGIHAGLEREQTEWVPGESSWSPNRVDALVWALTDLMLDSSGPAEAMIPGGRTPTMRPRSPQGSGRQRLGTGGRR